MVNDLPDRAEAGGERPDGWSDVTSALEALGDSIGRVAQTEGDEPVVKRHMRELAEGLAALARQVGDTAELLEARPARAEGRHLAGPAADTALMTALDAAACAAVDAPPEALAALSAVNAKFRDADAEWGPVAPVSAPVSTSVVESGAASPEVAGPVEPTVAPASAASAPAAPAIVIPEEPASVTGVIGAAISERMSGLFRGGGPAPTQPSAGELEERSIHDWLFPEGQPADEPDEEPPGSQPAPESDRFAIAEAAGEAPFPDSAAAPDGPPTAGVAARGGADAARIAHERFLAERKLAEEAAESAQARARADGAKPKPARRRPAPRSDDDTLW